MRKWIDRLFALYAQSRAPGFSKISQSQLLRADRQAFIRMSELFTGSLKAPIAAGKPLHPYIEKLESDMTVTYFMLPVPTSHAAVRQTSRIKTRRDLTRQIQKVVNHPRRFPSKGNSKGKKRDPIPQALKGHHARTPQGEPICFGFNLGTCKQGSKCPRQHVCSVPGCYKAHPQTEPSDPSDQQLMFHHVVASVSSRLWQMNMSTKMTM